tara:strand:- start:152 stop:595 length:444 start_codon:yes stop_codon:yes gene_type:complete
VDKIPNIKLNLINGKIFDTKKIENKTILFFYPKADTPGCTIEANEFQLQLNQFKKIGFTIIGCSKDPIIKNIDFAKKFNLTYQLASDLNNACEKLGIWVEKSMYGKKYFGIDRSTFIIDTNGKILFSWNKVKVKGHVDEVLSVAKSL